MASDPHEYLPTGLSQAKKPHACVVTIFGASGDLTKRKLIPALYNLALEKRLPERFAMVGYARSDMTDEVFRDRMREAVKEFSRTGLGDEAVWQEFAKTLFYVRGGYEDADGYEKLKQFIDNFDRGSRVLPERVFYLAMPPDVYGTVIERIAGAGLAPRETDGEPRTRVVIEKPFGTDLQTARDLNRRVHDALGENQIYRIDHYLGKEPVKKILSSVSPIRSSSRSGTGATSIMCRSRRRKLSESRIAAATMKTPAWCATCFRIICCSCSA